MLHVILYQPQIPQNTGNIGRLCAITGTRLHLIHPLGFEVSSKYLKRSGMDYWNSLDWLEHEDWATFLESPDRPERIWLFTTRAARSFWDARFSKDDGLLFGNEGAGCPEDVHRWIGEEKSIRVPHPKPGLRSLNLSTCAGIAVYEAIRQMR
jgi:tRNA (cytidine/uridine-2'-O-)-methyltransferase